MDTTYALAMAATSAPPAETPHQKRGTSEVRLIEKLAEEDA
jgi:hypothetical protein